MILKQLTEKIIKTRKNNSVSLISICGAADTGKSTLSKQICQELKKQNIECDVISTDSFMLDREQRLRKGFSGYNSMSLLSEKLIFTISEIENKKQIQYFCYDNKLGKNRDEYRVIPPIEILIIEGIHSFSEQIRDKAELKIFLDADESTLKKLRFKANINKRGFTENNAGNRINEELDEYYTFIEPNKRYSDIIINTDENFNYH